MGLTLENLSEEELCDLMCGKPEDEDDFNRGDLDIDVTFLN